MNLVSIGGCGRGVTGYVKIFRFEALQGHVWKCPRCRFEIIRESRPEPAHQEISKDKQRVDRKGGDEFPLEKSECAECQARYDEDYQQCGNRAVHGISGVESLKVTFRLFFDKRPGLILLRPRPFFNVGAEESNEVRCPHNSRIMQNNVTKPLELVLCPQITDSPRFAHPSRLGDSCEPHGIRTTG